MYNAISEEMLKFFAGVIDFNNIIGEPLEKEIHTDRNIGYIYSFLSFGRREGVIIFKIK